MTTAAVSTVDVIASANSLLSEHTSLLARLRAQQAKRRTILPLTDVQLPLHRSRSPSPSSPLEDDSTKDNRDLSNLPPAKRARCMRYRNYVPGEETIRNDYSQRFVDGGEWPQNWVLGSDLASRFEEYPKQRRLLTLKRTAVNATSLPPRYLPLEDIGELCGSLATTTQPIPSSSSIPSLPPNPHTHTHNGVKFDVILIDPPNSIADVQDLPVPQLAADPSFVFLWVGSGAGTSTLAVEETEEGTSQEKERLTLERGREILAKWGYRRCEDVCWVKTNKGKEGVPGSDPPTSSMLLRTKEHCLIGIRGTVRRSTDSWFVHCNVDTDLIIAPPSPNDPTLKPAEMYALIENFCLGARRLEIGAKRPRRGWVSVVPGLYMDTFLNYQQEDEEEDPTLTEGMNEKDAEAESNNEEDEMSIEQPRPERFSKATWEVELARLLGLIPPTAPPGFAPPPTARWVVPTSSETETLRPKSPVRAGRDTSSTSVASGGGGSGGGGGTSGGVRFGVPLTQRNSSPNVGMVGGVMTPVPQNPMAINAFNNMQMGMGGGDMEWDMGYGGGMQMGGPPAQFQGPMGMNMGMGMGMGGGGFGMNQMNPMAGGMPFSGGNAFGGAMNSFGNNFGGMMGNMNPSMTGNMGGGMGMNMGVGMGGMNMMGTGGGMMHGMPNNMNMGNFGGRFMQ